MEVTPMKRFSLSTLISLFKITFCKVNNCEVLLYLKPLRASAYSLLTRISVSLNKLRNTPTLVTSPHLKENTNNKEFIMTLEEINMVMGQLGFPQCCKDDHDGCIDILSVFDDEGPSLGEVKVAFGVFDKNLDGFIDDFELRRVLCNLGQSKTVNLEECRNMIKGFDVNGDGVIDFVEFVKLMETCCY